MKKRNVFISLIIIIYCFTITCGFTVPLEERKVKFMNDKWGRKIDKKRYGKPAYMKSNPYIKQDKEYNFRYMRAKEWNIIEHRFASNHDYSTFEEAARSYLSKHCYGPTIGINDESIELKILSEKNLGKSENSIHYNRRIIRFKQYYGEIPVIGSEIIVEIGERFELFSIIAKIITDIDSFITSSNISLTPNIDINGAEIFAKNRMAAKYQISSQNINTQIKELGIYSQYIFGNSSSSGCLVWKFILTHEDKKEMVLVSTSLSDTLIAMMPLNNSSKFIYHGKTGSICDTFSRLKPDIIDTPVSEPSWSGSPIYSKAHDRNENYFINSGIGNKVAYMLVNGDSFNGKTITGIGYEKTEAIFNEAQYLLTMTADYFDLNYALLQSCINLGYPEYECDQVMDALNATEMDKEPREYTPIHGNNDKPECESKTGLNSIFYDNFDSDNNTNWEKDSNIGEPYWFVPQTSSTIGFNQSFANSKPGNIWGYAQKGISDTFIEMKEDIQDLPQKARLFFNHAFIFDSSDSNSTHYNGGVVEYSIDGGLSWHYDKLVFEKNNYNGKINSAANPLNGRNAFVSKSNGYMATIIDLSELSGENVRFRFRLVTSHDISYYGWFIDDFQIYTCDIFSAIPVLCSFPTVLSTSNGSFSKVPGPGDIVRIESGHNVIINYEMKNIKAFCNYGTLKSTTSDLIVESSDFIYNVGRILAADGQDASWSNDNNSFDIAGDGKDVELNSFVVFNDQGGDIQAGRGGHCLAVTSPYVIKNIEAKGGNGGHVNINADYIRNKGNIGPKLINSYPFDAYTLPENLKPDQSYDGGNGGVADNGYKNNNCYNPVHYHYCANYGNAIGGIGGDINLFANVLIEHSNPGSLGGGNGGASRLASAYGTRIPGTGGNVVVTAPVTNINGKIYLDSKNNKLPGVNRKGGRIIWDPVITISGESASITGAENLLLFGGENYVIKAYSLTTGAISANTVDIKLGEDGIFDLSGNSNNVTDTINDIIKAKESVAIYVDESNIIVDGDSSRSSKARKLARAIDAPEIKVYSSEIEYDYDIDLKCKDSTQRKRRDISGDKNTKKYFDISINNNGPTRDAYILTINRSNLVGVSDIPDFIRINPMSRKKIPFEITLPEIAGDDYYVEIVAESCSTIGKKKSKLINLVVESKIAKIEVNYNKIERNNIQVKANPINEDITINSCEWNMGDNSQILFENEINYYYSNEGSYTILLTVTDSSGNTEQVSETVIIKKSKVLLMAADNIKNSKIDLISTGLFADSDIDVMDHPSSIRLEQLLPYNAVLVWSRYQFTNAQNIGEVLTQYVNKGGGVVLASYCFTDGLNIEGDFVNYSPFEPSTPDNVGEKIVFPNDLNQPDHFIFSGINNDIVYVLDHDKASNPGLKDDALLLAEDNYGKRVVAMHPDLKILSIAIYPESLVTNDAKLLFANSLLYVSGETSELFVTPTTINKGASAGQDSFIIIDKGNGTMYWAVETDDYWIHINEDKSGTGSNVINFSYDEYNDPDNIREGEITITALGALNSPQIVKITQGKNQPPQIMDIPDQVVCEDAEIDIPITVSDAETLAVDLVVFARALDTNLIQDSGIRFSNPGKERTMTIRPAKNMFGNTTIFVVVSDGVRSTSKSFVITVKSVNDAPNFTKGDNIVLKRDINIGEQIIQNWITQSDNGPENESNQEISYHVQVYDENYFDSIPTISQNGTLSFDPKDNFNGNAVISVYAADNGGTDDGGISQSEPQIFTIYYADELPDFIKGPNQEVNEDDGQKIIPNWATQIDHGTNDSIVDITFITVNDNPGLFTTEPQILDNGTLTYTLAPDANGTAHVTAYLKDNRRINKRSDHKTFIIDVKKVNDPPYFEGSNYSSLEDSDMQFVNNFAKNIVKGPDDEKNQSVRFNVSNCSNPDIFEIMPQVSPDGTLTYKSKADLFGIVSIDVTISDNGSDNSIGNTQTCTIEIIPVNDPPSFTLSKFPDYIYEDSPKELRLEFAKNITKGPDNENNQSIFFIVENDNHALFKTQPLITPDGTLEYELNPDKFGTSNISVKLQDTDNTDYNGNNISLPQFFTINVRSKCDPPSFNKGIDLVISESGQYTVLNWATNITPGTNEDPFYRFYTDSFSPYIKDIKISNNGTLNYNVQPGACGIYKATTRLEYVSPCDDNDDYGSTNSVDFYITVVCNSYSLSISKEGEGNIAIDGVIIETPWSKQYNNNDTEINLLASVEDSNWEFAHWLDLSSNQEFNSNPLNIDETKNIQLKAIFVRSKICFDFNLNIGYNSFSLPVEPSSFALLDLFPYSEINDKVSAYRYIDGTLTPTENFATKLGYWLYSPEIKKYTICGTPVKSIRFNLDKGFHFLGCINSKQKPFTIPSDNINAIYIWKDGAYSEVDNLIPGFAHWVEIKNSCEFFLEE